jgi:hypothetical protein
VVEQNCLVLCEPLVDPDEHRWWEMQLGIRLPHRLRHRSRVTDRPRERRAERHLRLVPPPADERRWWDMQLGKNAPAAESI